MSGAEFDVRRSARHPERRVKPFGLSLPDVVAGFRRVAVLGPGVRTISAGLENVPLVHSQGARGVPFGRGVMVGGGVIGPAPVGQCANRNRSDFYHPRYIFRADCTFLEGMRPFGQEVRSRFTVRKPVDMEKAKKTGARG